jgi:hypothetical protein
VHGKNWDSNQFHLRRELAELASFLAASGENNLEFGSGSFAHRPAPFWKHARNIGAFQASSGPKQPAFRIPRKISKLYPTLGGGLF